MKTKLHKSTVTCVQRAYVSCVHVPWLGATIFGLRFILHCAAKQAG